MKKELQPGDRVRCIRAKDAEGYLTLGKVYRARPTKGRTVLGQVKYRIKGDDGNLYICDWAARFIEVINAAPTKGEASGAEADSGANRSLPGARDGQRAVSAENLPGGDHRGPFGKLRQPVRDDGRGAHEPHEHHAGRIGGGPEPLDVAAAGLAGHAEATVSVADRWQIESAAATGLPPSGATEVLP